jgi:methyl coenzyme M reductase beta subunit
MERWFASALGIIIGRHYGAAHSDGMAVPVVSEAVATTGKDDCR